jgi:hypothetical protein
MGSESENLETFFTTPLTIDRRMNICDEWMENKRRMMRLLESLCKQ